LADAAAVKKFAGSDSTALVTFFADYNSEIFQKLLPGERALSVASAGSVLVLDPCDA
jgi:hypothetical protein